MSPQTQGGAHSCFRPVHKVRWPNEVRVSLTRRSKLWEQPSCVGTWKHVRLSFLHQSDFSMFPISFRPFSGGTPTFDQLLRGTSPWQVCLFDLFSDSLWKFILGISCFWFAAEIIFIVVIEYQLK